MHRVWTLAVGGLWVALTACSVDQLTLARRRGAPVPPAVAEDVVAELAARIPAEAVRCVASAPGVLDAQQRGLVVLVSQTQTLPWGVELPVRAYARARLRSDAGGRTLTWLEFGPDAGGRERIRAALSAATGGRLAWPGEGTPCRDATDCSDTRARFVAPLVVQLDRGSREVPLQPGSPTNACAMLRHEFPEALEVASWEHDPAFASDLGLVRTDQVLQARAARLTKLRRRRYVHADQRDVVLRNLQFGADDLPVLAGVPVRPVRHVRGLAIEESADLLWDDLRLVVADDERERRVRTASAARPAPRMDDLDSLRDQAQWMLLGLERKPPDERLEAARLLSGWLLEVRREHPGDEGLAAVQYRVFLDELGDPESALAVVEQVLALGAGDVRQWELNRRRTLSRLGAERLAPALRTAHGLDRATAGSMAEEIVRAVGAGGAFERAEWGWLAVRELREGARGIRARPVEPVTLPLVSLPQTLAYLATRSPALRSVYGVHVWARGQFAPGPLSTEVDVWAALSAGGGTGRALVAAASSDQHAKLRELGTLLTAQAGQGELEVGVSLRPLAGGDEGTLYLVFEGRRSGDQFEVRRMDARSAELDWPRVARLLAEPLVQLDGRAFPPSELRVPGADVDQAARMVTWGQSEQGVSCHHVQRWVVCRGPLHDPDASLRALLRIGDQVLGDESLRLWGRTPR